MENREKICAIALNLAFGFDPAVSRTLVERCGSAAAVFELKESTRESLVRESCGLKYAGRLNGGVLASAQEEFNTIRALGSDFLPFSSEAYPAPLKECEDAPAGLYFRSASPPEELFSQDRKFVSVVGTRDLSFYGREWCEKLVKAMGRAQEKPCIVSGLAIGIDICAHQTALSEGMPTIAVLPCGIDAVYPYRHRSTAAKIAGTLCCAVVTDYPCNTTPIPVNFLRRNRIIAGLSSATLLVESMAKGGGTMTARLASGYGREVFALPGRVDDLRSEGCNRLIWEQLAAPVVSAEELAFELGLGLVCPSGRVNLEERVRAFYEGKKNDEEIRALASIAGVIGVNRGITPEELCRLCALPYRQVSAALMTLESDSFISMDMLQRCIVKNF
ncbi:MAG: DNA-protecting protein DprA [Bacteroidales bacterium]|nr:DNA-protecting protein DprA [Bacteroidales bacterium]